MPEWLLAVLVIALFFNGPLVVLAVWYFTRDLTIKRVAREDEIFQSLGVKISLANEAILGHASEIASIQAKFTSLDNAFIRFRPMFDGLSSQIAAHLQFHELQVRHEHHWHPKHRQQFEDNHVDVTYVCEDCKVSEVHRE